MSQADALDAETVRAALADRRIGSCVVAFEEVTSTNDVAAQLAPTSEEGLVVVAERQTRGRGQYGRRWESAAQKGLWLSILLRPQIEVSESGRLTDLLSNVIANTIQESLGIAASVKLPNDIYIGTRKVAGVLVEMRVESGGAYCAIAGIGVNVNHLPADFPGELRESAGSLAMAAGRFVHRAEFMIALLRNLDRRYAVFRQRAGFQV